MNNTELHKSLDAVEQVFLTKATKDKKKAKQALIKQLDTLIIKAEVDMLEKHFVTPQFISKPTKKIKEVAGGVKRVGQALGTAVKEAYKEPAPLSDYGGVKEHLPKKESYGEYLKTKTRPQTAPVVTITKPKHVATTTRVVAVSPPKETDVAVTAKPSASASMPSVKLKEIDTAIKQDVASTPPKPTALKPSRVEPVKEIDTAAGKTSEETAKLIRQAQKKKITV